MFDAKAIYTVKKKLYYNKSCLEKSDLKTQPKTTVYKNVDLQLKDGFKIRVKSDYTITIESGHERGFIYAIKYIHTLINQQGYVYIGRYEDSPSFPIRGIIEGFYGEPWTQEDRLDMLDFLSDYRMNAYMYAPKDDLYHRDLWREPYPKAAFEKLEHLVLKAKENHLDFYFCISPGKDFNYTKQEDLDVLFEKINQVAKLGVKDYCLLLDDIDYTLNEDDASAYATPGQAHAYIGNALNDYLTKHVENKNFILCPTEYWQNYDTPYRQDLKKSLARDVQVFWTGFNTIAEYIPDEDGHTVLNSFEHPLVLWDNYPVNDVTEDLIFMGPLVNRGPNLPDTHVGMVANPMIQWELSKAALITMAMYMWDTHRYDPEKAYNASCLAIADAENVEALKTVLDNFRYSIISYDTIDGIEKAIEDIAINKIAQYYTNLRTAVSSIKTLENKRFIEQFNPWLERIEWDYALFSALKSEDQIVINKMITDLPNLKHTVGTNFAVKLAHKLGYYDGPIYKKYRLNFWEE